MDSNYKTIMKIKVDKTMKALKANRMVPYYVEDKVALIDLLKTMIKEESTVSLGGAQTLEETGVLDWLYKQNLKINDRYKPGLTPEEMKEVHRKSFYANYLFTSTNAITIDGKLVNIDARGNRLAAMIYGPDQVIIIAGINKIVNTEAEGYERIKSIAAPANCLRLNKKTPCTTQGQCMDCKSPDRICSSYVTLSYQGEADRISVILVGENYGY